MDAGNDVSKRQDHQQCADSSSDLRVKCGQFFTANFTTLSYTMSGDYSPATSLHRDSDQTSHYCSSCSRSSDRLHRPHGDVPEVSPSPETFSDDGRDAASVQNRSAARRGRGEAVWACVGRAGMVVVVLMSCLGVNWARPAHPPAAAPGLSDYEKHYRDLESKAVKYLAQFGYLTGPSRETRNLLSAYDLSKAIKTLQSVGGIPQTGVIDRRTEELMSKPRCGNLDFLMMGVNPGQGRSDLGQDKWPVGEQGSVLKRGALRRKRFVEAPSKWHKKQLTFRILNYTPDIKQLHVVRDIIQDAFMLWSNATQLQFIEVMYGNADIMIRFASRYHKDGFPFDGKGMILAHAFFPGSGKGGDTHFDDDEFWTTNSSDGVDLFLVAAHVFGHALGLAHSPDPDALMHPWFQSLPGRFVLPQDDREGIQKLYGPPQEDRDFSVLLIPRAGDDADSSQFSDEYDGASKQNDSNDQPPDPCSTPFDAVTIIRTHVFIFIGKWFWRLDSRGVVKDPFHIHRFWYGLSHDVTRIDAVLERKGDKRIILFSGDRYWVFNANSLVTGFPGEGLPITEFGIPADVKRIDAAFTWGFNRRSYLVSADMYWKLNANSSLVEEDYPRDMSIWRGVPMPLNAAMQYWDGKTYFFQGFQYWKFYDPKMRVDASYPRLIADDWLECSDSRTRNQSALHRKGDKPASASKSSPPLTVVTILLFLYLVDWNCQDRYMFIGM